MVNASDIEISFVTRNNRGEVFQLACEGFVNGSVLHKAAGVSLEAYRAFLRVSFDEMCEQELSLIATDTTNNKIVGCLIACDYAIELTQPAVTPENMKPVLDILRHLDGIYRSDKQIERGTHLLVDMAIVSPGVQGRGIYRKLRQSVHELGKQRGFRRVVGELSSAATQHICVEGFKHNICAEIEYHTFNYAGQYPFSAIREPRSIILVEGELC